MRTNTLNNTQDILDSRDVIARIRDLQDDRDDLVTARDDSTDAAKRAEWSDDLAEWTDNYADELAALLALQEQAEGYSDWTHGTALIRNSYFVEYAQELASDLGAYNPQVRYEWPLTCIDWDQAAEDLKQDYTEVDFDGVAYWVRS